MEKEFVERYCGHKPYLADLYILENFLPKLEYKPSDSPICMAVGIMDETEALALRYIHEEMFNIQKEKIKVVGCDLLPLSDDCTSFYDYVLCGGYQGNARFRNVWVELASKLGRPASFDIVMIRNPDLKDITNNWKIIFGRAFEFTKNEGVICTTITNYDLTKYKELLKEIKTAWNIEPAYSGPSGLEPKIIGEHNFVHTIGLFKVEVY